MEKLVCDYAAALQPKSVKRSGGYTNKEKEKIGEVNTRMDSLAFCFQPMAGCVVSTSYRRRLAGVGCEKVRPTVQFFGNSTRHRSA